jgi:hypothetical protein
MQTFEQVIISFQISLLNKEINVIVDGIQTKEVKRNFIG